MTTPALARTAPAPGDAAPSFVVTDDAGHVHRLADFRGTPLVLVFLPSRWDPARAELIDMYNRVVARAAAGGDTSGGAAARLLGVSGDGPWRALAFDDGELRLPMLADPVSSTGQAGGALALAFGVDDGAAVFVLDGDGIVRWRHVAGSDALPSPDEVARAIAATLEPMPTSSSGGPGGWSRRQFVAAAFGVSAALVFGTRSVRAESAMQALVESNAPNGTMSVTLRVNGRDVAMDIEPRVTLLDALRERAGLTGSKKGCDHGQCGACTVHVDGRRTLACLTLAVMAQGHEITTIEGLARGDALHPMQEAFIKHDGFQCGYCTPGQIMSAVAVARERWGASDDDVREAMSGNICRCGAYPGILAAVQEGRRQTQSASTSGGE